MLKKINSDVFNISNRIKKINKNFYLVFDSNKNKFVLYKKNNIFNRYLDEYILTLPFDYLDDRSIKYIINSDSKNLQKILDDIEENNKVIEKKNILLTKEKTQQNLEDLLKKYTKLGGL